MRTKLTSTLIKITLSTGIALLLTACGGSGGSSSSTTGTLNLAITDAPIDDISEVWVEFTGVELQKADGERINLDFLDDSNSLIPRKINLLPLNGGVTEDMFTDVILDAGEYSWMRLKVNAEKGPHDSYVVLGGINRELTIPSGSQSGLKLNRGFVVPAGGVASYTIDFDLRKSVHKPASANQDYKLRPTLRLVDNSSVGTLKGTVSNALIESECGGAVDGAVYVFEGDMVDDIDGEDDPITSATLKGDGSEPYTYTVAFLEEGNYKIAFT